MTREIPLTNGGVALVDDADYEWLSKWTWQAQTAGYAGRNDRKHGYILMHRAIMCPPVGIVVDHRDRDILNNCRSNLRLATPSQSRQNVKHAATARSPYKGIFRNPCGTWVAQIGIDGKRLYLGTFKTPEDAATAYDQKAIELFGDFAKLNFEVQA